MPIQILVVRCASCRNDIKVAFAPWEWALSAGPVYEPVECPQCGMTNIARVRGVVTTVAQSVEVEED